MGKQHERIDDRLRSFIDSQHVFFVGTAPLSGDGHVNVSPRGLRDTCQVIDDHTVAWQDLIGSGAETIAHLRENGRICLMFCAFNGPPNVVRLHGRGRPVLPADPEYADWIERFPARASARAVIVVDVDRISDSCGFGVPVMDVVGERDLLAQWAQRRDEAAMHDYQRRKNATSIDGLPAVPDPDAATRAAVPAQGTSA